MKTRFTIYALLFALLFFAIPDSRFTTDAIAVGTVTQTLSKNGGIDTGYVWTLSVTADSAAATIPNTTMSDAILSKVKGYYLYQIITNPGTTAPTDNYDIVITNSDGVTTGSTTTGLPDILGSQCLNRDTANTETCSPVAYYYVDNALTVIIDGNLVNSATLTVKVFFVK